MRGGSQTSGRDQGTLRHSDTLYVTQAHETGSHHIVPYIISLYDRSSKLGMMTVSQKPSRRCHPEQSEACPEPVLTRGRGSQTPLEHRAPPSHTAPSGSLTRGLGPQIRSNRGAFLDALYLPFDKTERLCYTRDHDGLSNPSCHRIAHRPACFCILSRRLVSSAPAPIQEASSAQKFFLGKRTHFSQLCRAFCVEPTVQSLLCNVREASWPKVSQG